jgi:hypothetical protein
VLAVFQSILLFAGLVVAYLTVREARAARQDDATQFAEQRKSERRRTRAESEKARLADREARLRQLIDVIADYEDNRASALGGDTGAMIRAGPLKLRLQTALIATGRDLPNTSAYIEASNPFPALELLDPAREEIQESLRVYATASLVPFEGEDG